jgi:sugar lactone lactonase YvrE
MLNNENTTGLARPKLCRACLVLCAVIAVAASVLVPQTAAAQEARVPVAFDDMQTFGTGEEGRFFQVFGAAPDAEGNVYVADMQGYLVRKYRPDGTFVGETGRRGEGPGEFQQGPSHIVAFDDSIAVFDNFIGRVHVFGDDLMLGRTRRLDFGISDVVVTAGGDLYTTMHGMSDVKVHHYDWRGRKLGSFEAVNPSEIIDRPHPAHNIFNIAATPEGDILLVPTYFNRIYHHDASGTLKRTLSVPGLPLTSGTTEVALQNKTETLPDSPIFVDAAVDAYGNIFLVGGSYSEHKGRTVHVLSPEGEDVATLTLPERTVFIHIEGDYLYAGAGQKPEVFSLVKKYRIRYGTPAP